MVKKKLNKFVVPREYNQSAIFAKGGNLYELGGLPTDFKSSAAGQFASGNIGAGLSGALGAAPGIMGLANSTIKDFDTSGIGKEVIGTQDMTRNDILNTNVNVDSQQKGFGAIAGDAASAAMAGMQVAGPWGALAGLVPIATGIFGNEAKQNKAEQAERQWTNNLQAKNRQFNQQDLRQSMANFSAMGGDLFAYGGQMPSQLTSFDSGGSHQSNPNGGILQGTGANGQPNLVEEGETKHEDYIFSDRLKINPQISKDFKLPKGLNGKTFADASKYLNREAKDRPNDPISKNGVKAHLAKLTAAQEGLKAQQQPQQGIPMEGQPNVNMLAQGYANGGYIDQTHYQNPTLQGANIGAEGMPLTKLNTPLVGIDQNAYARSMKLQGVDWKANPLSNVKDINEALKEAAAFRERNPYQQEEVQSTDFSRYAPVAANIAMGISDMFEKPEVVKYGRVNPERITARMDYQPVDTEWMNNKMNATYAGTRDQMINQAGGNRAMAMAGLSGINQQQQNAVGEAYLKAQDINYNRKNQATQFNAGIETQNVAAQNAAQQTNLQLQMQEMDANARNRAAKRNAARQAILNAASNIGDIGRENYAFKTGAQMTDYEVDPTTGKIKYMGNNKKTK